MALRCFAIALLALATTHCKGELAPESEIPSVEEMRAKNPEYAKDLETLCNAVELSGAGDIQDPNEKAMTIASFLKRETGAKVQKLLSDMAPMAPVQKAALLRAEASEYGVSPCPFVKM